MFLGVKSVNQVSFNSHVLHIKFCFGLVYLFNISFHDMFRRNVAILM
jgi:hypothetical protein